MAFAHSGPAQFLASGAGRALRAAVGLALIWSGFSQGGAIGLLVMLIGVVPLAAAIFDFCLLSRVFGGPLSGAMIRNARRA